MNVSTKDIEQERLLTEIDAARFLRISERTLQGWRCSGVGPNYVRVGRAIRYRRSDLIAWVDANTVAPEARGA